MAAWPFSFVFAVLGLPWAILAAAAATMAIEGRAELPLGGTPVPAGGLTVSLNGEKHLALTRADGSFTFPRVNSGIYLLDVLSTDDVFPQMKIQVNAEEGVVKAVEYKYPGATKRPTTYPLIVSAIAPVNYFQARPPFSVLGFVFANPMIILMGFSAIILVAMPQLLKQLDPEALKEYEEAQRDADPAALLGKFLGK